eukprot:GHUV01044687.1.p1 GENE.GHUV01044687.1~~GHUV01044687.1.p1  ORF type:complete len:119 (-),score=28.14 GHUV01044687.1:116-472(-)
MRTRVAHVLEQNFGLYPDQVPLETRYMVQAICRLVVRRSARMAAALLVAVLKLQGWMENPRRLVVAVDGGVFLKYPKWRRFLDQSLREAFGERTLLLRVKGGHSCWITSRQYCSVLGH